MEAEPHTTEPDLVSKAWLLQGLSNTPGLLVAAHDTVAFVSDDGTVFEAPKADITAGWPMMQMSGGAHLVVNGHKHRIAFVRPNGAADAGLRGVVHLGGAVGGAAGLVEIGRIAGSIKEGRAAGKQWKAYLS